MNNSPLFIYDDKFISKKDFLSLLELSKGLFQNHTYILVRLQDPLLFNIALVSSIQCHNHLFICPSYYSDDEVEKLCSQYQISLFLTEDNDHFKAQAFPHKHDANVSGALYIFTSATTGPAKITKHSFDAIMHSAKQAKKLANCTWLMSYANYTYAGLQVFFSAYLNNGTIFYPSLDDKKLCEHIVRHKVTVISATPSYWKMLILRFGKTEQLPKLIQATLGGEIVNQDVLDLVKATFNPEKITHIYASSEAGTSIVVSDGLAGFPISFLEKQGDVLLRIRENHLEVKSPYGMQSYLNAKGTRAADGWIDTGDQVEVRDDRVYFLGRVDTVINVGGLKVNPEDVEAHLCELAEIFDAVVYAKKSPITGSVVAADVVMRQGCEFDSSRIYTQLKEQKKLQDFKLPRFIREVPYIEVSVNGKKVRPK